MVHTIMLTMVVKGFANRLRVQSAPDVQARNDTSQARLLSGTILKKITVARSERCQ